MGTPLLFWETAEGDCTRYDLDVTGRKEDKLIGGAQVEGGKKAISLVPGEIKFLLKIITVSWSLLTLCSQQC